MTAPAFRLSLAVLAGIALTLGTQVALGQGGVAGGFRQAPGPAQRLAMAVRQVGVRTCAPVLDQAAGFLFEGGRAEFVVQPLGPDANRWPTVVTAESSHSGGTAKAPAQTRLTTLVVAPAGSCSGLYQQVIYWPESCTALKARVFGAFTAEHPLLERVRQSEANPGLQLYLLPAGTGCVSVKKELIG
jgi:hypothetical protein